MKTIILFVTFLALTYSRELVGTLGTSNPTCYSCIQSSSTYWCAQTASSSSGYCCNSGESKSDCLGSDYQNYVCSNEGLSGRAENLLCPKETSYCEDTSDFAVTTVGQSERVDTGIVGPGKTCEYRTYINNIVSTPVFTSVNPSTITTTTTYQVTVDIRYVYYETYLGVYKYYTDSNSYELIREVGRDFSGSIKATIDNNTEIYVQMHPFSTVSCAGFDIYIDEEPAESSDKLSAGIIVAIVISVLAATVVFGIVAFYCIYRNCYKNRNSSFTPISKPAPSKVASPQVVTGAPLSSNNDDKQIYYIGNTASNPTASNNGNTNSSPPSQNDDADQEASQRGVILEQIPVMKV